MDIIYKKKGSGKTTKLIKECSKMNKRDRGCYTYILVANRDMARNVSDIADKLGLRGSVPFPVTVQEMIDIRGKFTYIKHLLVDDLDMCLRQVISNRFDIPLATLRKETKDDFN